MNWAKDITVTPLTDEQACGGFTKGCPVDKAALPVNAANMNAFGQWMCAKMDAIVAAAIVRVFCNPTMATAAQITTICANLDDYPLITCVDGAVVGVPLSKLGGGDGGTDPGPGGCPADTDSIVRAVGATVVQWQGDWVDGVAFASTVHGTPPGNPPTTGGVLAMSPPNIQDPATRGFAGTWSSGATVTVQQNSENANLTCTTWTKTAC